MIRFLSVTLLFLQSCTHIDYSNLPSVINKLVVGAKDIEITKEYFNNSQYSFVKVRVGRKGTSIFVLSKIKPNKEYIWISADNERLITKSGKIIALYSDPEFSFNLLQEPSINNLASLSQLDFLVYFHEPEAIFKQESSFEVSKNATEIKYLDEVYSVNQIFEFAEIKKLNWRFTNSYWIKGNGQIIKAEEYIHPSLPKISTEYFFKY